MTEMMELVTVEMFFAAGEDCPFPHDEGPYKDATNDFRGDGGKLGKKMEAAEQTITLADYQEAKVSGLPQPFKGAKAPIQLSRDDSPTTPYKLPLTCAAHHLIPAQASLRESPLVFFMFEQGTSATFYESTYNQATGKCKRTEVKKGGGKLIKNLGYDVNGIQNGIWLPGPYGLRKKGVKQQISGKKRKSAEETASALDLLKAKVKRLPDPDPEAIGDAEDVPVEGTDVPKTTGEQAESPEGESDGYNYYFLYVVSSILKVKGQYHDAHPDFSTFILKSLNRLHSELLLWGYSGVCDQCPERKDDDPVPPPYSLLERLNHTSKTAATYLRMPASGWRWPLVTSTQCVAYWENKDDDALTLSEIEGP